MVVKSTHSRLSPTPKNIFPRTPPYDTSDLFLFLTSPHTLALSCRELLSIFINCSRCQQNSIWSANVTHCKCYLFPFPGCFHGRLLAISLIGITPIGWNRLNLQKVTHFSGTQHSLRLQIKRSPRSVMRKLFRGYVWLRSKTRYKLTIWHGQRPVRCFE